MKGFGPSIEQITLLRPIRYVLCYGREANKYTEKSKLKKKILDGQMDKICYIAVVISPNKDT